MKKSYLYGLALACTAAIAASSCSGKLDIPQKGVTDSETFYRTDSEAEEAATALYDQFATQFFNNGFYLVSMLDDDTWAAGDNRGANYFLEALNEFRYTPSISSIEDAFKADYDLVYRANLILHYVEADSPTKQRVIAEARFFRAYAYFDLVTLWGAVPLVDDIVQDGDYKKAGSTVEELYSLIKSDLRAAIEAGSLPEKTSMDDDVTSIRVTQQTAQALLGKVLVFNKEWQEAATVLDEVMSSGKYGLFQGDYGDIFAAKNNFNREVMLAVNLANDPVANSFTAMNVFHGWRVDRLQGLTTSTIDVYNMGWGFGVPTKSLHDAFVDMEGEDGYRLNRTLIAYDRLVSEYGVSMIPGQFIYGCEGWLSWKFRNTKDSYVSGTFGGFYNNEVAMRYAEVLLLAAEAHLECGNADKAAACLNEVRSRARLPGLDHAVTLDDIIKEKRLELCGENLRFKDLVRWGLASRHLADRGSYYPIFYGYKDGGTQWDVTLIETDNSEAGFKEGKHELLPIPQTELDVNPNISQNPGWTTTD